MNSAWRLEPSLISGFVAAILILLVAFGVPVTGDQTKAIMGVVAAGLMLAQSIVVRNAVYSPESVRKLTGEVDPPVPSS